MTIFIKIIHFCKGKGREEGRKEGMEEGRKEGRKRGRKEGRQEKRKEGRKGGREEAQHNICSTQYLLCVSIRLDGLSVGRTLDRMDGRYTQTIGRASRTVKPSVSLS